ncbi:MAG TPA: ribosomal protein S18-alanine N-acetyltransferase [Bryobacteraceae bacterium]|nr:ribosomal protein S18-alanine N-acetyltransferase [Bryobacteraceae bacterium]
MNWTIRHARVEDTPVLEEIERACFRHDPWIAADFLKRHCLVAEVDGRVVGFLVEREVYPGSDLQPPEREILNLAVLPRYRGMGIGRALLEQEMHAPGIYYLEVRESNLTAQRLYRHVGFEEVGRRPYYYQAPKENAIVMRMERC